MKEKVFEQIKLYATFTIEKEFAKRELRKIIEWAWLSLDLMIMDRATQEDIYNYAIEAICSLDN